MTARTVQLRFHRGTMVRGLIPFELSELGPWHARTGQNSGMQGRRLKLLARTRFLADAPFEPQAIQEPHLAGSDTGVFYY
jgi:hypothetical protein